jgi:hypothetical protein
MERCDRAHDDDAHTPIEVIGGDTPRSVSASRRNGGVQLD